MPIQEAVSAIRHLENMELWCIHKTSAKLDSIVPKHNKQYVRFDRCLWFTSVNLTNMHMHTICSQM